jgi:hypothetical protein
MDITAVLAILDPEGKGGRRKADDVANAVRNLAPHVEAAAIPELVLDTILRGDQLGAWSATRTATVRRGRVTLPKSVLLHASLLSDSLRPVGVPLRDELAPWAAGLALSAAQRSLLLAVNDWLRRTDGGNVPVIAAAERAYELVRDEKAFDSTPPRGGAKLWGPGRLTFPLLRCERVPTPLTWEPVSAVIGAPGPVICVENHATFRTLLRCQRALQAPAWVAVAWIQGRNIAPLESLPDLPFTVTRLDYLGDLDAAGLAIAAAACATAERNGVAAQPAADLWALLLSQPSRPGGGPVSQTDARKLTEWLPESLRDPACELLASGHVIPQEALRFDILVKAFSAVPGETTAPLPGGECRSVSRSEARGEFPVGFGHAVWQVGGTEQAGFEDFLRIKCQAIQSADENGFVVDLDAVLEAAADFQQPAGLDGETGFLADLAGDGVLVPFALVGVAGGEAPLAAGRPEPVTEQQDAPLVVADDAGDAADELRVH